LTDLYIVPKEIQRIHEKRKLTISIPSNGIMKYAVAAVIVLGLLIVSPHVSDIPKSNYASLASLSSVNSFENNEEQSIEKKVVLEKPVEVKKAGTDITKTKELAKVINNDVEADNYHVIVASLPTRASAQKLCDELIKDKFTEARVLPSSKMYRVAIQSFKSKGTADEFIQNLRKSDVKFETAWIFSK
jgi:cell division protein FtsN